jgi:hypothetical protein
VFSSWTSHRKFAGRNPTKRKIDAVRDDKRVFARFFLLNLQDYFHRKNLRQEPKPASPTVAISSVKRAKRYSPTAERFAAAFDYKRGVSENQAFRRKKF